MSHVATKWAFDQPEIHRDMKPAEWAVLVILADCHNPVNGCFPSQDYIASRTNLSERAVRDHLGRLRERQLIEFEAKREEGRRASNRYKLAFEPDFQPAESAGSSGGENQHEQPAESDQNNRQNLPPNPVREPVIEPVTSEREARAGETKKPDPKPDDDAEFQKLLKRYPDVSSPGLAFPPWLRLDGEGRRRALARLDSYVAERRKGNRNTVHTLQRYLGERLFDQVYEPADGKPVMTVVPPRSKEFWWIVARDALIGRPRKSSFDEARNSGTGLAVGINDLPSPDELASLVSIETDSAPFHAWRRWFGDRKLRFSEHDSHVCGKFIYLPSEWPPGWVHDPPQDDVDEQESEAMQGEEMQT